MEEQAATLVETSTQYVGRWNRLVSTTNWEKGRIIFEWRAALQEAGAAAAEWSDEAWSRQVGGVSPQHVGRLRRTFERFGEVHDQYAGLYWSHFHAALDWPDAEMFLQGAVESGWSVAEMRNQRSEVLGDGPEEAAPTDAMAADAWDDDAPTDIDAEAVRETFGEVHDADVDDNAEDSFPTAPFDDEPAESANAALSESDRPAPLRPFESLPKLPPDLNEGFELMKLAILNHKVSGWQEIACQDVLAVLDALRQLALAPAD